MDQGSSKNGRFGGWSQRYSNGAGWCARFTRAPTQAEWNSAGASNCAAYPGASGHCGAVCGTSFNTAPTTPQPTPAPTTALTGNYASCPATSQYVRVAVKDGTCEQQGHTTVSDLSACTKAFEDCNMTTKQSGSSFEDIQSVSYSFMYKGCQSTCLSSYAGHFCRYFNTATCARQPNCNSFANYESGAFHLCLKASPTTPPTPATTAGYPADCDTSKYFMSTPYEQTNIASSTDLADMISKCRSQYMDKGSSNGQFGGWSQRYSNGGGWCARFTRAPTQAEWNSAGASSCAAYPGASGHCGAVCGTSFNAAATTTTTTTAPTTPCRVTVYEHWPEGMTTGIVGLEIAETNWGGRFPTGASLILNGTGNHALGVLNNLTSSVKVEGPCCKAYGHTSTDCSGTDGTPICSNTTYLASMPAGLVTPASGLSKVWECGNDRAQCVKVTQTCP